MNIASLRNGSIEARRLPVTVAPEPVETVPVSPVDAVDGFPARRASFSSGNRACAPPAEVESSTPYRVIDDHTCNSRWTDPHRRSDPREFLFRRRHQDMPQYFACGRIITSDQVQTATRKVPQFAEGDKFCRATSPGKA